MDFRIKLTGRTAPLLITGTILFFVIALYLPQGLSITKVLDKIKTNYDAYAVSTTTTLIQNSTIGNDSATQISNDNASDFKSLRDQYLSSWEKLGFRSVNDTFIKSTLSNGYGIYDPKQSNVFGPNENIILYVEPVGFSFKPVKDQNGNSLYLVNLTADMRISDLSGNEVFSEKDISFNKITSYNKNTELFMVLTASNPKVLHEGDYKITYTIKDNTSGKSFNIVKAITINNVLNT